MTVEDIDNDLNIWGKNIAAQKVKTNLSKPNTMARDSVKIPVDLLKLHKKLFLTLDIYFVNKRVNNLAKRTVPQIFAAFKKIYQYYLHRGFRITTVHLDDEFAPPQALIESLPGDPMINMASANKHVPDIERKTRAMKERCRATWHGLPLQRIPKLLTIHLVFQTVKLLNSFPTKGGISDTFSPKTIISGETLDYKNIDSPD